MTTNFRADVFSGSFAILAGVFHLGVYWGWWWEPPADGQTFFWRIGLTVVLMVVVAIIVGIVSGILNRNTSERDERETLVSTRSMRNVAFIYSGALAIIMMEAFESSDPMVLVHGIIGAFIIGEIVRLGSMAYYMRRGY